MSSTNDGVQDKTVTAIQPLAVGVKKGAAAIGVSLSTVWTLIRQGKIPTRKVGTRRLILMRDLEAFLAGGDVEIDPPSAQPAVVAHRKRVQAKAKGAR